MAISIINDDLDNDDLEVDSPVKGKSASFGFPDVTDETPTGFPVITRGNPFMHTKSLIGIIRYGLAEIEQRDRDGRIYASQAAHCVRKAVLSSTQVDEPELQSASDTVYFKLGNVMEDLLLTALTKRKALLYSQYKLPDVGLNMGGYIDGIAMVAGKIRALEIKTCGTLPTKPKLEHKAQAMVYAAITGLPASLLYFSRHVADFDGTLKMKEFPLNTDVDETRKYMSRVSYVREAITMDVVPDIPEGFRGPNDCGRCKFKENCWGGMPLKKKVVEPDQHVELTENALKTVNKLMDPVTVTKRRNGVLVHIQNHGTDDAKEMLQGDWTSFLD